MCECAIKSAVFLRLEMCVRVFLAREITAFD